MRRNMPCVSCNDRCVGSEDESEALYSASSTARLEELALPPAPEAEEAEAFVDGELCVMLASQFLRSPRPVVAVTLTLIRACEG